MTDQTLEQKAVEIITNLQNLAEPAMQLTLQSVRVEGIVHICISTIILLASVIIGIKFAHKFAEAEKTDNMPVTMASGIAVIVLAISAVVSVVNLSSVYYWIAVFSPELALAGRLLDKAT